MLLFYWSMIITLFAIVKFIYYYFLSIVPKKAWYMNIFLIINECCITALFSTAIIFAYLDKISKLFKLIYNFIKIIKILN